MSHKTQVLPSLPKHARILKHHRKVGGDCGVVRDVFGKEGEPWIVLALLSGMRTVVPASWTDLPPESFPATTNLPQLSVPALAELARLCQGVLQRSNRRPGQKNRRARKRK